MVPASNASSRNTVLMIASPQAPEAESVRVIGRTDKQCDPLQCAHARRVMKQCRTASRWDTGAQPGDEVNRSVISRPTLVCREFGPEAHPVHCPHRMASVWL